MKNREKHAISVKKYSEKNKEHKAAYQRRHRKTEHGKIMCKLYSHRRNQRKRNLATDHDLTNDEWQHILESQDNKCLGCGKSFEVVKSTIDHIHPVLEGGLLVKENVQALCDRCNPSKGTKTMEEFLKSKNMFNI